MFSRTVLSVLRLFLVSDSLQVFLKSFMFSGVFVFFGMFLSVFRDVPCVFFWAVCVFFRERFGEVRGSGLAEVGLLG